MRHRIGHLFALCGLVFSGGCDRSAHRGGTDSASSPPPNLLIITLDTTRADRLGCYGYDKARTPVLDALAASGVRFERAYCQVPLTLPSHVTLLTGRLPPTNGVRVNAAASLGTQLPTLAEQFKNHGYETAAFVSAFVLDSDFGLGRGFDLYDDALDPASAERPADKVCDVALEWLERPRKAPFFAWVHFYDPHYPYDPPQSFRDQLEDPYDGEVAFVDQQVGRLVTWLEKTGRRERTIIVVAGDHGESFGEHDEPQHGLFLYDSTLRVPWICSAPSHTPRGRVVSAEVQLVDIFPTVMELMGWESPPTDGRSAVPAWSGGDFPARAIYVETQYPWMSYGWSPLEGVIKEGWKFIDAPRPELYNREVDPGELNNLIATRPEPAGDLQTTLTRLEADMEPFAAQSVQLGGDARTKLESLGYVASGSNEPPPESGTPLRDPKDGVSVYREHFRGNLMLQRGNYDEAVRILEAAVAESPESDEIYTSLGKAYLELGRAAEAQAAFSASLRKNPDEPHKLWGLGEACRRQQKTDEATRCFNRALERMPDLAPAHLGLGLIYAAAKDFERALKHCRRHLELDPTSQIALTNLASVLIAMQRYDEAAETLEKFVKLDPTNRFAQRNLWQALRADGRTAEAVRALRRARDAFPNDAEFTCSLAWMLAITPGVELLEPDEAVKLAKLCQGARPDHPRYVDVLAAAYASHGDFSLAVETAKQALALAQDPQMAQLRSQIEARLRLYKAGEAYRE